MSVEALAVALVVVAPALLLLGLLTLLATVVAMLGASSGRAMDEIGLLRARTR